MVDGYERFWDINRDGHLDNVEKALRDEYYMKELFGKESGFVDDDDEDDLDGKDVDDFDDASGDDFDDF